MDELKNNWEKAVLALAVLVALAAMVVYASSGDDDEGEVGGGKAALVRESALSPNAFAFLTPKSGQLQEGEASPFRLPIAGPEPPKPPPPVETPAPVQPAPQPAPVKPVHATRPKKTPSVLEEDLQEPAPAPKQDEPQKPVMKRVVGTVQFTFQQQNQSGKTVALLTAHYSGGATETFTVGVGESFWGVTVKAISNEKISLVDARNRRWIVSLGGLTKVNMVVAQE